MDFAEYERAGINAYKEFAETVATLPGALIAKARALNQCFGGMNPAAL